MIQARNPAAPSGSTLRTGHHVERGEQQRGDVHDSVERALQAAGQQIHPGDGDQQHPGRIPARRLLAACIEAAGSFGLEGAGAVGGAEAGGGVVARLGYAEIVVVAGLPGAGEAGVGAAGDIEQGVVVRVLVTGGDGGGIAG